MLLYNTWFLSFHKHIFISLYLCSEIDMYKMHDSDLRVRACVRVFVYHLPQLSTRLSLSLGNLQSAMVFAG